jgi:hypothetical protein
MTTYIVDNEFLPCENPRHIDQYKAYIPIRDIEHHVFGWIIQTPEDKIEIWARKTTTEEDKTRFFGQFKCVAEFPDLNTARLAIRMGAVQLYAREPFNYD